MCIYDCACEYSDTYGRVHIHRCAQVMLTPGVFLRRRPPYFLRQVLCWDLNLGEEAAWWGGEPQGSAYLCLSSVRTVSMCHHNPIFTWVQGMELMFV